MTAEAILRFERLAASYGRRVVFTSASLALAAGVYALQGTNGSGKSTLLRLLAGAQPADKGEVWIDGASLTRSPRTTRQLLSYMPDESPIYPFMTGRELLQFVATVKKADASAAISDLIDDFGLLPHLDTRFDAMSLGTQKKMLLCAAWIGTPRVFLLDEPSNGLDLGARDRLASQLRTWGRSSTILFTAHDSDFVTATNASRIDMQSILAPAALSLSS